MANVSRVLNSFTSYNHAELKVAFFGHNIDVNGYSITAALLAIFMISRIMQFMKGLRAVNYMPGMRIVFPSLSIFGVFLPVTWWNPGLLFAWNWRYRVYQEYQSETISSIALMGGPPVIHTSNLDVAKQVAGGGNKTGFIKPENASRALLMWGMNLIAADGDTWRKHRRIMGPAFTNQLYKFIWAQNIQTYRDMVASWKDSIDVPVAQKLTYKLSLINLGRCAFGLPFDWNQEPTSKDGKMSIQDAMHIVADTYVIALFMPNWIKNLPFKKFRDSLMAYNTMMDFMRIQIAERQEHVRNRSKEELGKDAFTMLVSANAAEDAKLRLSDEELVGNVFVMMFAGHETTACTLAATLALLSVHENIQEDVYQHILEIIGPDLDPVFDDYPKLNKVLAVFYESLRMFPPGYVMIREAKEDIVLQIPNPVGQEGTTSLPVPKGVQVIVDMVGVQNNPRYFDEPEKFKPSRWHGVSGESEVFSAFSIGPRACIGRKFALVESIGFLALLLREWRVEPLLKDGETKEQWQKRVLDVNVRLILEIKDTPIRFVRRSRV